MQLKITNTTNYILLLLRYNYHHTHSVVPPNCKWNEMKLKFTIFRSQNLNFVCIWQDAFENAQNTYWISFSLCCWHLILSVHHRLIWDFDFFNRFTIINPHENDHLYRINQSSFHSELNQIPNIAIQKPWAKYMYIDNKHKCNLFYSFFHTEQQKFNIEIKTIA